MARSDNQRLKLLRLKQYLLENTDENNAVRVADIVAHMEKEGVSVERKTVYTDIDLLNDNEIDIEIEKNKKTGEYRVVYRDFELSELQLIIDSVQLSRFIPQKRANDITEKLKKLTSRHERTALNRRCFVADRIRSKINPAFLTINEIHKAIETDKKIQFIYSRHKSPKIKTEDNRIVSPISLIWHDNNYYLFATNGRRYRVDRMNKIKCLDEPRQGMEKHKNKDFKATANARFSVFEGKEEFVTLLFENHLTDVVFDRFGDKTTMNIIDDNSFSVWVKIEVNPQFFGWLFGLGKGVKVLNPVWVVEKYNNNLAEIAAMYQ